MKGLLDLQKATRSAGMQEISLYAFDQGASLAMFSSHFDDLTFEELTNALTTLDAAAAAAPQNYRLRVLLIYGYALARDAKYSHAGRRFIQGLGVNNALRGLYEGGKSYLDVSTGGAK